MEPQQTTESNTGAYKLDPSLVMKKKPKKDENKDLVIAALNQVVEFLSRGDPVSDSAALSYMDNIFIHTELFWKWFATKKDNLSYSFEKRRFPDSNVIKETVASATEATDATSTEASQTATAPVAAPVQGAAATTNGQTVPGKKETDYDENSFHALLNRKFIDEGVTNVVGGKSLYRVMRVSEYGKYHVNDECQFLVIFRLCHKRNLAKHMLLMFCNMCLSREFCHIALNNAEILGYMQPLFAESGKQEIISYCMFYGFYLMYKEECISKIYVTMKHRFVFDLETASKLPICALPLDLSPYIPVTLSTDYIYNKKLDPKQYLVKPIRDANWRIATPEEFKARFHKYTQGIFEGLDWSNLALTGSSITACAIINPLEMTTGLDDHFEEKFMSKRVIKQSRVADYEDVFSDIDIIVNIADNEKFTEKAQQIFEVIANNIYGPDDERDETILKLERIDTLKAFKYKIKGSALLRTVELFRTWQSPIATVSRFHFPSVRAYYDGTTVHMVPSFVAAAFTGVQIDYKWVSCNKKSTDLILKYYSKGFATLLNTHEQLEIFNYADDTRRWKYLLQGVGEFRTVSINNPAFQPLTHGGGKFFGLPLTKKIVHKYIAPRASKKINAKSSHGFDLDRRYGSGYIKTPDANKIKFYL